MPKTTKTKPETATTGEAIVHKMDDGSWSIWIPLDPVPASRPRFSRWGGVHYGKRYTEFRKQAASLLEALGEVPGLPLEGILHIDVVFHVRSPKKTTLKTPRGDVDNYFKTLDVLNEVVWKDDSLIESALMTKKYADDLPGIELTVYEQLSQA
jgi:Holliday junction resolvase RusA-like endonuclease